MAKKRVNKKEEIKEVVANSSRSEAAKPSGDHLEDDEISLTQHDIEKLIITVRGKQVLIDRDLAMIYGVETKVLNQAAKRNIARFPERYRFQLTKEEMMELVTNCDRFRTLKHSTSAPYAYTVFGVSMIPSVLTSQKAIETSIRIIDAFVAMRRFIVQNAGILMRIAHLERHQIETDEKIDLILDRSITNNILLSILCSCLIRIMIVFSLRDFSCLFLVI
jgi:ORF6N domain.